MLWLIVVIVPYLIIYLYIFSGLTVEKKEMPLMGRSIHPDEQDLVTPEIFLSVLIPLRNEALNIPALVCNLSRQSYPDTLTEFLFIDDNSSDNTFKVTVDATDALSNFKVCHSDGSGKKDAISTGIKHSIGELIITTDADCIFGQNWLMSIQQTWLSSRADVVIGPVIMEAKNLLLDPFIQLEHISTQAVTMASSNLGRPVLASGANLAFTKDISLVYNTYIRAEIGSGDDMFLLHYAKKENRRITFNHLGDGVVKTLFRGNLKEFLKQRARWSGKGIYYNDPDTIILGVITAVTNMAIFGIALSSFFYHGLITITLYLILLKSIPDILILLKMTWHRKRLILMVWFFPMALIYPVYVTLVTLYGILFKPSWRE